MKPKSWRLAGVWLSIGLCALLASGCTKPATVGQTTMMASYHTKLQKLLVTVDLFDPSMSDTNWNALIRPAELKQSFAAKWQPLGISVEVVDLKDASNKAATLAEAKARFGPSHVLDLKTSDYNKLIYVTDGYSVSATLTDANINRRVWSMTVNFNPFTVGGRLRNGPLGSPISHQSDADDCVDLITTKLKSDGLL
jgi:hypothetical protein